MAALLSLSCSSSVESDAMQMPSNDLMDPSHSTIVDRDLLALIDKFVEGAAPKGLAYPLTSNSERDDLAELQQTLSSYSMASPDLSSHRSADAQHSLPKKTHDTELLGTSPKSPLPVQSPVASYFNLSPSVVDPNGQAPLSADLLLGLGIMSRARSVDSHDTGLASLKAASRPPSILSSRMSRSESQKSTKCHNRRGSAISITGLSDLGSAVALAAPPALSHTSVGMLHATTMTHTASSSSESSYGLLDTPDLNVLPFPLLPDHQILSKKLAQAEATSLRMNRISSAPVRWPSLDRNYQTQSVPGSRQVSGDQTIQAEDSDAPERNPLYEFIAHSQDSTIKDTWQNAGLLLLPPRNMVPPNDDLTRLTRWTQNHAFALSSVTSGWKSLGDPFTASFGNNVIYLSLNVDDAPTQTLQILGETTVYRRKSTPLSPPMSSSPMTHRRSTSRMRAPRWLQRASFSRSSLTDLRAAQPPSDAVLERVRLINVDRPVDLHQEEMEDTSMSAETSHTGLSRTRHVSVTRNLIDDVVFFLDDTYGDELQSPLEGVLQEIAHLSNTFASTYVYVKGYEQYTAQRIRRAILDKVWGDVVEIFFIAETRLFQMVENIVMGFLHQRIFVESLLPLLAKENRQLNTIIAFNHSHATATNFGLSSLVDCSEACSTLQVLNAPASRGRAMSSDHLLRLAQLVATADGLQTNLLSSLPPFDILTNIRHAIDDLVKTADATGDSRGTGIDELLPLLAFAISKANVQNLASLLFYVEHFTQSSLGPEFEWSLATFQAAVTWLRTDSPGALAELRSPERLAISPTLDSGKRPNSGPRRHTDDGRSQSPNDRRRHAPRSHLYRCDSFSASRSGLQPLSPASRSSPALVDLDLDRPSLHARRALDEKHIPAPLYDLPAADSQLDSAATIIPLTASPQPILSPGKEIELERPPAREARTQSASLASSTDMRRNASENSHRISRDWTAHWTRSPLTEEASSSPRSSSPPVSEDEGLGAWFPALGWSRRRLSSVTSVGSNASFEAMVRSKLFESSARHGKGRAHSIDDSALNLKSHIRDDGLSSSSGSSALHSSLGHSARRQRPLSIMSISSITSSGSESAESTTLSHSASLTSRGSRRKSGLRQDLLFNQAHHVLPAQVDRSSAISYSGRDTHYYRPIYSPIREVMPQ